MFITCLTYRQATYAPDQNYTGTYGSAASTGSTVQTTVENGLSLTGTEISLSSTQNFVTVQSAAGVPDGSVFTAGNSAGTTVYSQQSNYVVNAPTITFRDVANTTSTTTFTRGFADAESITFSTSIVSITGTGKNLSTQFSFSNVTSFTGETISSLTTSSSYTTVVGTVTFSGTVSTSSRTTVVSGSSTTATTSTAGGGGLPTSISSAVTATTATNQAVNSTTTATVSRSIWTTAPSTVKTTTAAATTTITTQSTATAARATTVTTTTATPPWWGWSSERGTLLLATGNFGVDLPAWLEKSNYTAANAALWNCNFTSQTTLWPAQPIGTTGPIATSDTSAIANTASITLLASSTFTLFGTSTYTTTTSAMAAAPFTDATDPYYTTAAFPLSTIAQTVTSFTQLSATVTGFVTHILNTTTSTTTATFTADIVTLILTSKGFASSRGSFVTQVTLTTLAPGYTTATAQTGDGVTALISTYLRTAPQISFATTTLNVTWFYDTSCPTALSTGTQASATATGTALTLNGPFGVGLLTFSTGTSSGRGYTENFTQNVFAAPFLLFSPNYSLTSISGSDTAVYAPAAVTWWEAMPTMQGFAPMSTSTGASYQDVSAPAGVSYAGFMPYETGTYLSFNSTGAPVTSTAWGLWAFLAVPVTTTFASTSTTGTTTTGFTGTSIASFTFAASGSNGTMTYAETIAFSSPAIESGGSFTTASTATATTTQATTTATTTTTSSTSGTITGGFTLTGSVTSTFARSFGYSGTTATTETVSSIGVVSYFNGTTLTATYNYITTATLAVTNSYSTSWNAANTVSQPTAVAIPGVGGYPQITAQAATIFANGAAVSLFAGSTFTWSTAFANFGQIIVGANFTTTSSTTSSLAGAGAYPAYTIPGQVSMLTSPASVISTAQNKFVPGVTTATNFWATPAPFLTPNGSVNQ